jgi:hypothetical protein
MILNSEIQYRLYQEMDFLPTIFIYLNTKHCIAQLLVFISINHILSIAFDITIIPLIQKLYKLVYFFVAKDRLKKE